MDKKEFTALVLLDLSKAFDSINHHRVLHKLANVGASPTTVQISNKTYSELQVGAVKTTF